MAGANLIQLEGNLTRDPETRTAGTSNVTSFRIANNTGWGDRTRATYIDCEAWTTTGEFVQSHFTKGKPIRVTGQLLQDNWTTDSGESRSKFYIRVDRAEFVDGSRREEEAEETAAAGSKF
jgi:single-strand DNA-binding protein